MGNAGSQTGQLSQGVIPEGQWVHSFPRTQPTKLSNQHKVLPERNVQLKLRSTNNGEILHSGGTLSGRPSNRLGDKYHEYPAPGFKEHIPPTRKYFPKERDPQHKSRAQGVQHKLGQNASSQNRGLHGQMKMYVSEPDLRYPSNQEFKEKRPKKKYKAPPPPQNILSDERPSLDWTNSNGKSDLPIRKARLFKTRAETKKQSSHVQELSSLESSENTSPTVKAGNIASNRISLQETKQVNTENFYKELKEATKRLRHIELDNRTSIKYDPSSITNKEKLKTLDHNTLNAQVKEKLMEKIVETKNNIPNCARGEASGKESTTPEMSPNLNTKVFTSKDKPRTFYFGMNDESNDNMYTDEMFDNFTANLHQKTKIPHSSESDISSYIDSDENDVSKSGIDLQLRPILPKKQLEIPRFSPAAAWRLLSMDTIDNTAATTASDDVPVFIEERIEKYARPPPPFVHAGQRSSNDKSGDSGISGDDAIPITCYEDNNDSGINQENHVPAGLKMLSYLNNHERISWTPQQDLGDDSSIEEFIIDDKALPKKHTGPHLFSLSLPRDNQLASYMIEKSNSHYSGLQKLKKSLSGVLNNLSNRKDYVETQLTDEKSSNWFLSKSAPNSLNNAFHSLELRKSQECELIYPQNLNKTTRLMYLPEMADLNLNKFKKGMGYDIKKQKTPSLTHSKSYEDITVEARREPEPLQDPETKDDLSWRISSRKPKKFTFQSTIRQIEKKRLSDKLSREAERREQKRIQELEAMQKVEEEFQKKRAREKANIRQQLRLYCLDEDPTWSSLPPNLEMKDEIRPEPDGAFSSSTSSSSLPNTKSPDSNRSFQKFKNPESKSENKMKASTTRELSEFRQVQRDYKDYRGSSKYANDGGHYRQTTVHPQVTCNMPKVKGMKPRESSNYRKDFASGVRSSQSAGSTYSEDSQNMPRMYNKHAPMSMSYLDQDLIHC